MVLLLLPSLRAFGVVRLDSAMHTYLGGLGTLGVLHIFRLIRVESVRRNIEFAGQRERRRSGSDA